MRWQDTFRIISDGIGDRMNGTWKAQAYAAHSKGQAVWAKELIEKIGLSGNESILDIGCGDGKITNYLSEHTCGEVVGVDLSAEMIIYAQTMFQNPRFVQMDARRLEFEERFDVVFSNAALHWVSDHEAVMRGVYRALKPNGKALLQMGGEGNASEVFAALAYILPDYAEYFEGFKPPYRFCSDMEYREILRRAGFSRYRAELIPKDMVHDDTSAFRGWLETTWFPFIQRIPEPIQDNFIRQWINAYIERVPVDESGKVHVVMVRLEVEANII